MPTNSKVIVALLEGHWYDAMAALFERRQQSTPEDEKLVEAQRLATAAKRVLDLDAEDFSTISSGFQRPWARRLAEACFPLAPKDQQRGALGSLVPLYELMLEVMQLRAARHEPLQIVVTAHLIAEYLGHLAWEPLLGHAGDPLLMAQSVDGRWGSDSKECPHNSAQRATAKRALKACDGDVPGYTAYLDRFHSRLGDALSVCAMNHLTIGAGERPDVGETCPSPCGFVSRIDEQPRRDLDARIRLARIYEDSPIVSLRHHAPVGHFFGVPSVAEISDAWLRTFDKLTQPWNDGENPLLLGDGPKASSADEALPGLSALVSTVAGQDIRPGRVIRSIGDDILELLELGVR